jgi:hypothetical protein
LCPQSRRLAVYSEKGKYAVLAEAVMLHAGISALQLSHLTNS